MSFIKRLKDAMADPDANRGLRHKITVRKSDLKDLIYHFERLDNEARNAHFKKHLNDEAVDMLVAQNKTMREALTSLIEDPEVRFTIGSDEVEKVEAIMKDIT